MDQLSDIRSTHTFWRWDSPWAAGPLLFLVYVAISTGTALFIQHRLDPSLQDASLATPWLAVGVGVVGVLLGGARLWPALFFGSWVVWGLIVGDAAISVTVDAVAETGSILLIVRLLSIWGFHRSFDRFRDPLILLAAATIGRLLGVVLDCAGGFVTAWLTPESLSPAYRAMMTGASGAFPVPTSELFAASARWALNCIVGVMLVVPLASATWDGMRKTYEGRPISLLGLSVALAVWGAAALTLPGTAQPLLITALMLVAWAAIVFGPPTAAFATLIMALVATAGVDMHLGPLSGGGPGESVGLQWGFITLLGLTGLSLTALLAERRHDMDRLTSAAERYRRLFKFNPSPLWVAEPNGGRILMVNDEAVRHYGFSEAEFLAMTVAQLAAEPGQIRAPASGARGARSLRHRTRGGAGIDVELLSTSMQLDNRTVDLCYAVDVTDRWELRSRILAAADLERARLVQELHDGLGQVLTGVNYGVQAAAARASRNVGVDAGFVDFVVDASANAIELFRQLTRGVSPLQDADGDLLEALRRLPSSLPPGSGPRLEIEVESRVPLRLSLERSEHLYRVVQEAVANALKHAHAAHIRVRITVAPETVRVDVEDDGVGIGQEARPTRGLGMRSMELRAAAVGASVEVSKSSGGGTLVRCVCPQQEQADTHPPESAADDPQSKQRARIMAPTTAGPPADAVAGSYIWECLLLAVACFVGIAVSHFLAGIIDPRVGVSGPRMAVPSLSLGFAVAGLILGGRRLWPGVALGALAGAILVMHEVLPLALYYAALLALVALIVADLLSRGRFNRAFDRWQDPILLIGAAVVGGSVISALDFVGLLTYQWLRPGEMNPALAALMTNAEGATPVVTGAFLATVVHSWADCVAGVVLFVPMLVVTPSILHTPPGRRAEAGAWFAALLGWMVCMVTLNEVGARWPLVAVALVLLVWAAARFGVAMAAAAIAVCAMAATLSFALQRGVLITIGATEGIDALWGFLLLLAGIGLFLMVLLAERNRRLHELDATAQRYQRMFALGPHPLWVQDRATGRIIMVNDQAVRHYGYSVEEWLTLTADQLAPTQDGPIADIRREIPDRELAPVETRHRLKSGALIEVELSFAPIDMGGRATLLCFAVDVTERNALRRGFLEATDLARRRLVTELHRGIGRALSELEVAALRFKQMAAAGTVDTAALELIAQASRRAAEVCRQTAHAASLPVTA